MATITTNAVTNGLKSILEVIVSETPETSRGKDVLRLTNQFLSISTDTLYQELSTVMKEIIRESICKLPRPG